VGEESRGGRGGRESIQVGYRGDVTRDLGVTLVEPGEFVSSQPGEERTTVKGGWGSRLGGTYVTGRSGEKGGKGSKEKKKGVLGRSPLGVGAGKRRGWVTC